MRDDHNRNFMCDGGGGNAGIRSPYWIRLPFTRTAQSNLSQDDWLQAERIIFEAHG